MVIAGMVTAPVPPDRLMLSGFIAGIVRPPEDVDGLLWPVMLASSGISSMVTTGVLNGRLARKAVMVPCDELAPMTIWLNARVRPMGC